MPRWEQVRQGRWVYATPDGTEYGAIEYHADGYYAFYGSQELDICVNYGEARKLVEAAYKAAREKGSHS